MKQLISLLLIISITIISWSSFAKSTVIQVNNLYSQPYSSENPMILKIFLYNQLVTERFFITPRKTMNKHNDFFETTMIFNEKLQQFIAFFNEYHNEVKVIANNNISSPKNSTPKFRKCKVSS